MHRCLTPAKSTADALFFLRAFWRPPAGLRVPEWRAQVMLAGAQFSFVARSQAPRSPSIARCLFLWFLFFSSASGRRCGELRLPDPPHLMKAPLPRSSILVPIMRGINYSRRALFRNAGCCVPLLFVFLLFAYIDCSCFRPERCELFPSFFSLAGNVVYLG